MSNEIVKSGGTLAERLAEKLMESAPGLPPRGVLLLDVSGSMCESTSAGGGERKIDALRKVVRALNPARIFAFSTYCDEMFNKNVRDPWGDTMYGRAFDVMHEQGIKELVMVTDGEPTDRTRALDRVKGLRVEVIYVGPQPRPKFLQELVDACGGTLISSTLSVKDRLQLVQKIRGLLTAGQP